MTEPPQSPQIITFSLWAVYAGQGANVGGVAGLRKPIRLAQLLQEVNDLTQSLEVS